MEKDNKCDFYIPKQETIIFMSLKLIHLRETKVFQTFIFYKV